MSANRLASPIVVLTAITALAVSLPSQPGTNGQQVSFRAFVDCPCRADMDRREDMPTGEIMPITVQTIVRAPIERVWQAYTTPEEIIQWNAASDDWHTTRASVDLRPGGAFSSRMEAKDGSFGFDFARHTEGRAA